MVVNTKRKRLSRCQRSAINRQAWRAAQGFEVQERARLRALPHLTRREANRLAHTKARNFYLQERERLLKEGFRLTAPEG